MTTATATTTPIHCDECAKPVDSNGRGCLCDLNEQVRMAQLALMVAREAVVTATAEYDRARTAAGYFG